MRDERLGRHDQSLIAHLKENSLHYTNPSCMARIAAYRRVVTPSFVSSPRKRFSTAFSLTPRSAAVSRLFLPSTTHRSTSCSRVVSAGGAEAGAPAAHRAAPGGPNQLWPCATARIARTSSSPLSSLSI